MSTSEHTAVDFDRWVAEDFAVTGGFTALIVLVEIAGTQVTPVCSTYLNVIGADFDWDEMTVMFAGAGAEWNGAAFYPVTAMDGGLLDNPAARLRLRELEARLDQDRLVLNEGHFFDKWGRRLVVEEVTPQ